MDKLTIYRIITQNYTNEEINNYIYNKNISLKKYKTSINLPKDIIINNVVMDLIKTCNYLNEIPQLAAINFGDCLIAIRDKCRHYTIYDNQRYLLPRIHDDNIQIICGYCWQSICKFSKQICMKIGKEQYKARRKKLLLFRKSEAYNLIDNDILIYIYQILMFTI